MMWCYCHHLRVISKLRSLSAEDNFNNTFTIKSFFATSVTWNWCKVKEKL